MTHKNDGARPRLISWSITGWALLILAAAALLPRCASGTAQPASEPAARTAQSVPDARQVPQTLPIAGRVVDRKGQAVAGAKVYFYLTSDAQSSRQSIAPPVRATTGADGKFQFTIERIELASGLVRDRYTRVFLAAFAEGFGAGWTDELTIDDPAGNHLELVADDAPIAGRLIDLEGRPLPDVTVRVVQVDATPTEDLSPWLSATQSNPNAARQSFSMFTKRLPASLSMLIPPVKTGPDGRFQLRGAGRERIVSILIQGAKVQTRALQVMTRVGSSNSIRSARPQPGQMALNNDMLIYAIGFEHVAGPGRSVEGDVVDAATGRPVPGVAIYPRVTYPRAFENYYPPLRWRSDLSIRVTTDARGHYRLDGLPVGHPIELATKLGDGMAYRPMSQELPHAPGVETTRLDFKLVGGIPVQGKVTNRMTGEPVAAFVECRPTLENPNLSSSNDVSLFEPIATRPDGSFTLSALPGPGVVVATVMDDRFLTADRTRADRPAQARQIGVIRGITSPEQCQALEPIAPESTAKTCQCNLSLVPAPEPIVRILDPNGQPLAGAFVSGAASTDLIRECWWQSRHHGTFRVTGLTGHRIRILAIHHEGRQLAGTVAVRDAEPGPLTAKLRSWGTVTGRLVDRAGRPRAGMALSYQDYFPGMRPVAQAFPKDVTTDSNGRFTFVGLVPEQEYVIKLVPQDVFTRSASVDAPHATLPGETKDLGDVMEVTR
jgi:protocatechuate 3,4-dioxygenase beta subunit